MYRTIFRHLRRSTSGSVPITLVNNHYPHHLPHNPNYLLSPRYYAFSSAEEANAERRRRKRRLRIEPPMFALRRDPSSPPPNRNNQTGPRLPDSTSALVGPRLNIHNRVQSLIRAGDLDSGAAIARHAVFSNVRPTVFTCNAIIAAMYRAGRYHDSKILFQYFFNQSDIIPNIVSYNSLIQAHCGSGDVDEAMNVYNRILEEAPFSPSHFTYRYLTKGLVDAGRIQDAVDLLREMLNKGQGADSLVYNNLISGFLEIGNLDKAKEFFEELQERCTVYDGVVSATFMDWYFKQGREKEAMDAYRYLMDKQFRMVPATCNVLLEVLLRHGKEKEAWDLFDNMLDNHTPPTFQAVNSDTFNIMVNQCFRMGNISEAVETFKKVGKAVKSRPFAMDVAGFNNMIIRFCELDMTQEAEDYLAQLQSKSLSPDVTSYRTLIDAYVRADKVDEALDKYSKMVEAGLRVIPSYANQWFGYLIEKGKATECVPILTKLAEREPKPDFTTYDVVIKGLCGMGDHNNCRDVVGQMIAVGVGVTAPLKEYLFDVFEKEGRRGEIERIVNARFPLYAPPRPAQQTHKPWMPSPPSQKPLQASSPLAQTPLTGSITSPFPAHTSSLPASTCQPSSVHLQSSSGAPQNATWQISPRQSFPQMNESNQQASWNSNAPQTNESNKQASWNSNAPQTNESNQQAFWNSNAPQTNEAKQQFRQNSNGPQMNLADQQASWNPNVPQSNLQSSWNSNEPKTNVYNQQPNWNSNEPKTNAYNQQAIWNSNEPKSNAYNQQPNWNSNEHKTNAYKQQPSRNSNVPQMNQPPSWNSIVPQMNSSNQLPSWNGHASPQGSSYNTWQGSVQSSTQPPASILNTHSPWQPSSGATSNHTSWQEAPAPSRTQSQPPQTEWKGTPSGYSNQEGEVTSQDAKDKEEGLSQIQWQRSYQN